MPKKILKKIIRQLDSSELESFTIDKQSGELCYLSNNHKNSIKIPDSMCRDFFQVIESALTDKQKGERRFRVFYPQEKISISLKSYNEGGQRKISAEFEKPGKLIGLKQLGFDTDQQKKLKLALKRKRGLIVAGLPAGEGLSNLIYSLAAEINFEERDAYLLSANQEHKIKGINFIPLEYPSEEDLRKKLEWLGRKNAEVIVVPEIYERQTALELIKLANLGHLVIAGCRSRDTFSVVNSFLKSGPAREVLSSFSLVISGRRVKHLCPGCVEKYPSSKEEINTFIKRFSWKRKTAESLMPKKLFRSLGCPKCNYQGYLNKTGIYEVLSFDQDLRSYQNVSDFRSAALEKGHRPLIAVALNAARNGIISLQEILSIKF